MKLKHLLIGIILLFCSISCSNRELLQEINNPKEETTLAIQESSEQDTTCYSIVETNDAVYVLQNQIVTHEIKNKTGSTATFTILLLIMTLMLFLLVLLEVWEKNNQ
jgi:ABC-type transport system involved in multi-copper enzyme maturation permease subunit